MPKNTKPPLTPQAILAFINAQTDEIGRREIADAFFVKGDGRIALKTMLKDLVESRQIVQRGKRYRRVDAAPSLVEVRVVAVDEDGRAFGMQEQKEGKPTRVMIVMPRMRGRVPTLAVGDLALVKLETMGKRVQGRFVRKVDAASDKILGVFSKTPGGGMIVSTNRKNRHEYFVPTEMAGGAVDGDFVEAVWARQATREVPQIVAVLGSLKTPKTMSLIAIHSYDLPSVFSDEALHIAKRATVPPLGDREDLRSIPLVTIDDEDARDFDDAVWAGPDQDLENPGGWHIVVAIADVSTYVTPGSALDREAQARGNSVYFPDQVVPMLPEALSNEICSLKPNEDRACVAAHLWVSKTGKLMRHRFCQGLMKSAARLTYAKTQAAIDGEPTDIPPNIVADVIRPLYQAYATLCVGRDHRQPLALDLPEERIYLDDAGRITKIAPRARFDSHRLIEEFMILANVAAATFLEGAHKPTLYRVHDLPAPEKLEVLRDFLKEFSVSIPVGQAIKPSLFNHVLKKVEDLPLRGAVHQLVLRSQAQAVYSPDNIGHFGLNLQRYSHFTSPIRRYADLLVHRGILSLLKKDAKLAPETYIELKAIGEHISDRERRAASAERDTVARYVAAYLSENIGEIFMGTLTGVVESALFVRIEANGAEGIIPLRLLSDDYYAYDAKNHRVRGRRRGGIYALGDRIKVKLFEADPLTGGLTFLPVVDVQENLRNRKNRKIKTKN